MLTNLTRMTVNTHLQVNKRDVDHQVYEGEVPMDQQQQDYYKQLIGDGLAKITVTRELSESNYGNGGKLMVSVTLTCDQSQQGIAMAIEYARSMAESKAWEHHGQLKQQLIQRGILTP